MMRILTRMTSWAGEEWECGLWSFFPAWIYKAEPQGIYKAQALIAW